jgi:TonB family protein
MKHSINLAMIIALCATATFSQDPNELNSTAKARIEQARASIVVVKVLDESNKTISHELGFFIRKDLVATDNEVADRNSGHHVTAATKAGMVRVLYPGHYFLPYVLVETQPDVTPLSLADSERLAVNDSVYMLSDSGEITAGRFTGTTTIKNTKAFLISLPINSDNKGAPIFNRYGEVVGIAAKSPDGQSAGLAWPSELLATLKHLGEPGVGAGRGDGPQFSAGPAATNTASPSPTPAVVSRPVRLSSPRPQYTEEARANSVSGTVMLRVQVDVDGNVSAVRVVSGLPYGLTEKAIDVARGTKFKPAMKEGKPVAVWIGLEINFNLY